MEASAQSAAAQSGSRREWPLTLAVFVAAAALLWLMAGNLFVLGLDEGIYLQGGVRILHGQVPYRDFFALTGPGSFWLEAAAMKIFGVSLAAGRAVMIFDIALITALVYWLVAQLVERRRMALAAAFVFFACETGLSFRLYANHRWDSGALAMAAIAFAFRGTRRLSGFDFLAAGFFAAAAAWCTPSLLLLVFAFGFWTLTIRELRKHTLSLAVGVFVCSIPAEAALALHHALVPMMRDMLWTAAHYAGPNHVYYGYGLVPHGEGLAGILAGAHGAALLIRLLDFVLVLAPVALPVVVYAAWLWITRKGGGPEESRLRLLLLLMISSAAMLLSTYPRWSADQLMFVAPVFYVLAAIFLERIAAGRLRMGIGFAFLAVALVAFGVSISGLTREPSMKTRVGTIRAVPQDQALIAALDDSIPAGASLYVYPYLPVVYFLTRTENPASYDFLQPGMMTTEDEQRVLAELQAHPPDYVVYFEFPPATFFGIWPNANPRRARFPLIESYLHQNYFLLKDVHHPVAEFAILARSANVQQASR